MNLDFYKTIADFCEKEMKNHGLDVSQSLFEADIISIYYSYSRRVISAVPRNVLKSNNFICPSTRNAGLNALIKEIESGNNIRPYQSKNMSKPEYEDGMVNAWKIHHFHLGEQLIDGWIERTGELLFAMIDHENFYCLGVGGHGDWTKQEFMEIVHENWPRLIKSYKIKGVNGLAKCITNEDLSDLRRGNVNTPTMVSDGSVYMTPGMGVMSSGDNAATILAMDKLHLLIEACSAALNNHIQNDEFISKYGGAEDWNLVVGPDNQLFCQSISLNVAIKIEIYIPKLIN